LIEKVKVGEWSIIGAGAVVVQDIPPRVTAVGVPARIIKHHE
jgi:acetyltransferase EpsM